MQSIALPSDAFNFAFEAALVENIIQPESQLA